jgi:hypothetical protein
VRATATRMPAPNKTAFITAAAAVLILLSGCGIAGGAGDPSFQPEENLSQPAPPEDENSPKWPVIEGKTHYDKSWGDWFNAGQPDNGELALMWQWRTPDADIAAINYLENDEQALGYAAECDDPASQRCIDTLNGFSSFCQQLYDMDPGMLSLMGSQRAEKDPTDGMLDIYCPEVRSTYADFF